MTTITDIQATRLAAQLACELADKGALHRSEWDTAVRTVLRHIFVPSYHEQRPDCTWRTVSSHDHDSYDEWLTAVYSDRALVTALHTDDETGQATPISSSSQPSLMVRMLETLNLRDGHRVLEIGTGTGYNAGLLCARLGAENVASVDVELSLVETARRRLAHLGYRPTLAVTDGAHGLPETAPYDRIIATCSVPRIPRAWIDQLTPDGRILTDFKIAGDHHAGNLLDLRATPAGLEGRFLPKWAGFMRLRPNGEYEPVAVRTADLQQAAIERHTAVQSAHPWWDDTLVWFLAALELPHTITGMRLDPDTRTPVATMLRAPDGSWADVTLEPDTDGRRVVRGGGTDLWAAVEHAYTTWHELGQPGWDRFGLTVTDHEHRCWFDQPHSTTAWTLPV